MCHESVDLWGAIPTDCGTPPPARRRCSLVCGPCRGSACQQRRFLCTPTPAVCLGVSNVIKVALCWHAEDVFWPSDTPYSLHFFKHASKASANRTLKFGKVGAGRGWG